jgi:hypothetical protein
MYKQVIFEDNCPNKDGSFFPTSNRLLGQLMMAGSHNFIQQYPAKPVGNGHRNFEVTVY